MKSSKHSDHKPAQPPRNPGRDFHSDREEQVRDMKEGANGHKDDKHKK
jgi:hypothetical protein